MPWVVGGAILGGALIGSESASSASNAQAGASEAAIAEQRRQFDISQEQYNNMTAEDRRRFDLAQQQYEQQRAEEQRRYETGRSDYAPWREAGQGGVSRLSQLLGIGEGGGADFGSLNKQFTVADFMEDPAIKLGYQTGLEQGTQAINRMAGARGSRNSGATLKELTRFGTDYTGQKAGEASNRFYENQNRTYNRLAGISGLGQVPSGMGAQPGRPRSGAMVSPPGYPDIAGTLMSQGNARGASAIAQGNIWGGAVQNFGNWYGQNQMLNRMYPQSSSPSYYYGNAGVGGGSGGYDYAPD